MTRHDPRPARADETLPDGFWTGKAPSSPCPGLRADGTMTSLPQVRLDARRSEILDYFDNTWTLTEVLFSGLRDAAFYQRPYHRLRHPLIFYYGHPASLYVNKLRVAGLLKGAVHAGFERLFETGVDEMRWDDMHEGDKEIWPTVQEVRAYRRVVYGAVRDLIETTPLLADGHPPITQESQLWALVMGFEHERIHLETSSVLMRELPIDLVRKPREWPAPATCTSASGAAGATTKESDGPLVAVAARDVEIGKPRDVSSFGWDNEYGAETRRVRAFSAGRNLITNGEFHAFVQAGGYATERYWSAEGWAWRRFRNTKWPTFWVQDGPSGGHWFRLRTVFEIVDMPWSWPVCVNYHEAKAYCAWRTERESRDGQNGATTPYRLLTEAEHHALRSGSASEAASSDDRNSGLRHGSERSVHEAQANGSGFTDVFGNLWQWCEDHFHPLASGAVHPYYEDFSAPCYDGEHQMILGGSFVSTGDEAGPWARFHFRPHFFQHAGFRIVRSDDGDARCDARVVQATAPAAAPAASGPSPASPAPAVTSGPSPATYETRAMVDAYMLMHWGSDAEIFDADVVGPGRGVRLPDVVHLPVRCAELVRRFAADRHERALDLGCAVGRASFEMARSFEEVVGVDFSHEFIAAANEVREHGSAPYRRKDSGDRFTELSARVGADIDRSRTSFERGDACDLRPELHGFDAVLLANVLCRLPRPAACLARMSGEAGLVKPGGVLVMTTPLSWLPGYTPRSEWIEDVPAIGRLLPGFALVHEEEIPFVIREHRRKFEYIITHASVWRRER